MVPPAPEVAPVIPPTIVPIVHVNVLAEDEVSIIFVLPPLQIVEVLAVVTIGTGLTVTVIV